MPKLVKEISEGVGYSYSSEQGQIAEAQPRVFRVILNDPSELFDVQQACGVKIGDELRPGAKIYCTSFDARFEGSSRLVLLCTFQFRNTADAASSGGGSDPKSIAPDLRPPNWTTSTSLIEQPAYTWRKRTSPLQWANNEAPAANPVGDIYDGVTRMVPVVTISIEVWSASDPTTDNQYAGKVNSEELTLGTLVMKPHTLMFRGVQCQPAVESWGGRTYRGWRATYEFAYKKNETTIIVEGVGGLENPFGGPVEQVVELGWDVAIPQSGLNVFAFAPPGDDDDDPYGQPLKFDEDGAIADGPVLAEDLAPGKKARAMVRVPLRNKSTQAPSASPIPLNDNGRPRAADASPKVLVYGYAVQPELNFRLLNNGRPLIQ